MKPVVKPPGSMLLKLRYDGPLSNFGFNFNLRRYTQGSKDAFQHYVFVVIVLTYVLIILDVIWAIFQETTMLKKYEKGLRNTGTRFAVWSFTVIGQKPPVWAGRY